MKKAVVILFLVAVLSSFVYAVPPEPMAFYGDVTMNGSAIPNGYYLTAKILGTVSGQCEVIGGNYGKGQNTCIVQSYSSNNVQFFLGNIFLGEYPFQGKEIVNLDFETDSLPSNFTPLSNGICEPSKGECSYNLLDCGNSITTVCVGNGICDSNLGETCSNAPSDCGACPTTPSTGGSSGGGGGGGGSGGGGGGGGSGGGAVTTPQNVQNIGDEADNQNNDASSENLNEDTGSEGSKKGIFGITGLTIGEFAGTTGGSITIIVLAFVILGALYYIFFGKNK